MLIVFEGIDGSGKSTQVASLKKWLKAQSLRPLVSQWNSSPDVAPAIKRLKKKKLMTPAIMAVLHAADFQDRLAHDIQPRLDAGGSVICDRYSYSARARDEARGATALWLRGLYAGAPQPDVTFYMRIAPADALERIGKPSYYEAGMDMDLADDREQSFVLFQARVVDSLDQMAQQYGFVALDGLKDEGELAAQIQAVVTPLLKGRKSVSLHVGGSTKPDWGQVERGMAQLAELCFGPVALKAGPDETAAMLQQQLMQAANAYLNGGDRNATLSMANRAIVEAWAAAARQAYADGYGSQVAPMSADMEYVNAQADAEAARIHAFWDALAAQMATGNHSLAGDAIDQAATDLDLLSSELRRRGQAKAQADFDDARNKIVAALLALGMALSAGEQQPADVLGAAMSAVTRAYYQAGAVGFMASAGPGAQMSDADVAWLRKEIEDEHGFLSGLFDDVVGGKVGADELQRRLGLYQASLDGIYNGAKLRGDPNKVLRWVEGPTKEKCADCVELNGTEHPASFYIANDFIPGKPGAEMECQGWECQCGLIDPETGDEYLL